MQQLNFLTLILLLTLAFACGESATTVTTTNTETPPPAQKEFPAFFQKILNAHGGLERWNAMNTLKFTVAPADYVVDLQTRKETIAEEGKYTFGNDGDKVWITPHRDSFPSKQPRFMKNLRFYFVAIPFVFADDGVNLEDQGMQTINEKEYQVTRISFGENVGDAPEDEYYMYVDPTNSKIDFITYSVTYFDQQKSTKFNALKYEWADANGILFPTKMLGYKWENNELGEMRYERVVSNTSFSKDKMEDGYFAIPAGAWTD
ncbi:MAG: DUF6503 family protein [Saprospiraceae bacterium]